MSVSSELDSEVLERYLPTRPVHSLRQIQALYGTLVQATGTPTPEGQSEYSLYFTPDELDRFVTKGNDSRFLVSVEIDARDPSGFSYEGVDVRPLTKDLVTRIGFARQPAGRAIDHSITRRGSTTGSDAEQIAGYLGQCLTRWTNGTGNEPIVGEVADEHADGWLIKGLIDLGENEAVQEKIEQDVKAQISDEPMVVASVKLRLDADQMDQPPAVDTADYCYPGEIPVFNEAMKQRKIWKLTSKNIKRGKSEGEAADMVTGDMSRVVGTAEDPFELFTLQHTEKFDSLDREESWREHPISADAALLLQASTGFLEACRVSRNGLRVYTLPYFTEMDARRAELLYHILSDLEDYEFDQKHPMVRLEEQVAEHGTEQDKEDLRFYVLTIRNDQGDIYVFHEVPDVTLYWPREVARAHENAIEGPMFGRAGFKRPDNWRHLDYETDANTEVSAVVGASYARDTVAPTPGDDGAMADDPSEWLTAALLTGDSIDRKWLLDQYVQRIAHERERDEDRRLSRNHVLTQFAQLQAFEEAGLVTDTTTTKTVNSSSQPDGESSSSDWITHPTLDELENADNVRVPDIRNYRLGTFIDQRERLRANPEVRGAFLTGVLLGQVSQHQRDNREMNRTYADRYQAEDLTKSQVQRLLTELLDKDRVYAGETDYSVDGSCFPETTDRITETLADPSPMEWELPVSEMRYYLSLGVVYGQRAQSRAFDLRSELLDEQ